MDHDIDRDIADLARAHHGLFNTRHLRELGVSKATREQRLGAGRWEHVADSVYRMSGAPPTWRSELLAACWAGGDRALASHRSAAALWELPGGSRDFAEILAPRWRRTRTPGILVHETKLMTSDDIDVVDAIPVTTIERTIFDLARRNTYSGVDILIDSALRRGLTTLARLDAACERLATRGRPGAERFRTVVGGRIDEAGIPESPPERLLARDLVAQGLPQPTMQFEVRTPDGRFVARVDLAYPEERLAIEYDSFEHHTGRFALVRDSDRRNRLLAVGWTTLTATNADVRNQSSTLAEHVRQIRTRLRQQAM